jgi:hypothetical protein
MGPCSSSSRALSFGRNLSHWPFIVILMGCFGIERRQLAVDRAALRPVMRAIAFGPPHPAPGTSSDCEHLPLPLVEVGHDGIPTFAKRLRVDHADPHTGPVQPRESVRSRHHTRLLHKQIHSVVAGILTISCSRYY